MIVSDRNTNWQVATGDFIFDCPFCGTKLIDLPDDGETPIYVRECPNEFCPYATSQDIRNVVASLEEAEYDIATIAEIVNNIEIAELSNPDNPSLFIDTREKVDWAFKKLVSWDRYITEVEASAKAEIEAITSRKDAMLRSVRNKRDAFARFAEPQIERFARADMAVLKKQSADYLYGTVKVTKTQQKLKVINEDLLLAKLVDAKRKDLYRVSYAIAMDPLKKAHEELPDDMKELIEVIPAGENVKITPKAIVEVAK